MARTNIYNPTSGQRGYQVPGAALQPGWQWETGASMPSVSPISNPVKPAGIQSSIVIPSPSVGSMYKSPGQIADEAEMNRQRGATPTPSVTGTPSPTPITDMSQYNLRQGETIDQYNARISGLRGETPVVPTSQGVPSVNGQQVGGAPPTPTTSGGTDNEMLKQLLEAMKVTPEETGTQQRIDDILSKQEGILASRDLGVQAVGEQPIATPFITGQQTAITNRAAVQSGAIGAPLGSLQRQMATLQAKRQGSIDATKAALEYSKPITVGAGQTVYDPTTRQAIYTSPMTGGGQASDIQEYNLAVQQGFTGSLLEYKNAEKYMTAVGKVVTDTLTGRQMIINPVTNMAGVGGRVSGGGATNFGTTGGGTGGTTIPAEIQPAISEIGGIKFIDQGKLKTSQLPTAQRISAETGIPFLTSEQANKVRDAQSTYTSAIGLVNQITTNGASLFTAKSIQEAMLQGPQLSVQAAIKGTTANLYKSTMGSLLSILTRAAGEKGVLTTQDVERIEKGLPTFSYIGADTAQSAQQKLANFGSLFNQIFQGSLGAYMGQGTPTGGTNLGVSKGSQSDRDFVENALNSQGISYNSVISKTPNGTIPVLQNSTGQVGYIPVEEFSASLYTKL